ncbi:MAG: MarR family transcriptional regulator [Candidatus Lokiarchaeota archaeon]|nr:MarR family transcriptional regulator [Candidatus Lokiarchaeota archaeon]
MASSSRARYVLLVFFISITVISSYNQPINAYASSDVKLSNVDMVIKNLNDGASWINYSAHATNVQLDAIDKIDLRFDLRDINMVESTIQGNQVAATTTINERYSIVTLTLADSLIHNNAVEINLYFSTNEIHEQIGTDEDNSIILNEAIYYFRPGAAVENLTLSMILPEYSLLSCSCASPVFPKPDKNYTDGRRIAFVWKKNLLLPGQEIAYIVKYNTPISITSQEELVLINLVYLGLGGMMGVISMIILHHYAILPYQKSRDCIENTVVVSSHEKMVLDYIRKRGGSCSQRDIYRELGLSQSMASMVLTNLEERKIVKRIRKGRENKVHLLDNLDEGITR